MSLRLFMSTVLFFEGREALLPATYCDISPGARHLVPMLQVDFLHSTLSVWLGT